MDLKDIRDDYVKGALDEEAVPLNPIPLFGRWLGEAMAVDPGFASAMTLSTVSPSGAPSSRVVLLKGMDEEGFRFFASFDSRKARELSLNNRASMLFFWKEQERQVRLDGPVSKIDIEKSRQYFFDRPRGSRISALISPQSEVVPSRRYLEDAWRAADDQYRDEPIPFPDNWGGYALVPERIEFWQGRPNRLHDRLQYTQNGRGWVLERLGP